MQGAPYKCPWHGNTNAFWRLSVEGRGHVFVHSQPWPSKTATQSQVSKMDNEAAWLRTLEQRMSRVDFFPTGMKSPSNFSGRGCLASNPHPSATGLAALALCSSSGPHACLKRRLRHGKAEHCRPAETLRGLRATMQVLLRKILMSGSGKSNAGATSI